MHDRSAYAHDRSAYAHDRGPEHGRALRKACCDRPPWVLCHDRECPVATEMARPVLRQRIQCCDRVWPFGVMTQSWCRDRVGLVGDVAISTGPAQAKGLTTFSVVTDFTKDFCRDRVFPIATESAL